MKKLISLFVLFTFGVSCVMPPNGFAQTLSAVGMMPQPGMQVALTPAFIPAHLQGMKIDPNDPLKFNFLIYRGDEELTAEQKQAEYPRLIKYFLAALAVSDREQWVNLSPYEQDRIIPDTFGLTEMGRDLLAQDYLLKQISASLTSPDSDLGKKFWDAVYASAYQKFGTTDIPTDTFNKVWITPDKAVVYEKGDTVYVVENHLKVQMESDYAAQQNNVTGTGLVSAQERADIPTRGTDVKSAPTDEMTKSVMREVIIPALEKEVNEGRNFAPLRQVYSGMLLATWYKRTLKESILGKLYADQGKVRGVDQDPANNQRIYDQYVAAFKQGVFNMIREDVDRYSNEVIPRKYFSGGTEGYDRAEIVKVDAAQGQSVVARTVSKVDAAQVRLEDAGAADRQAVMSVARDFAQKVVDYVNTPGSGTTDNAMLLDIKKTIAMIKLMTREERLQLPSSAGMIIDRIKALKPDAVKKVLQQVKTQGFSSSEFQRYAEDLDLLVKSKARSMTRIKSFLGAAAAILVSEVLANTAFYHMPQHEDPTAEVVIGAFFFMVAATVFGWNAIFPGRILSVPDQARIAKAAGGAGIFSDGPYTYDKQQDVESFVADRLERVLEPSLKGKRLLQGVKVNGVSARELAQNMVTTGIFRVVCINPDRPLSERRQWAVEFDAAQGSVSQVLLELDMVVSSYEKEQLGGRIRDIMGLSAEDREHFLASNAARTTQLSYKDIVLRIANGDSRDAILAVIKTVTELQGDVREKAIKQVEDFCSGKSDAAQKLKDGNALFEEVRAGNSGPYIVTFERATQAFTRITIYNGSILLGERPDGISMPFHPTEVQKFDDAVAPVVWQEFYKSLAALSLSQEMRQRLDEIFFQVILSGKERYEAIREIVRILEDSGSAEDKARIEDLWQRFSSSMVGIESFLSPEDRESVWRIRQREASLAAVQAIVNVLDAAQKAGVVEAVVQAWPGQTADMVMKKVFDVLEDLGPGSTVTAVWDKDLYGSGIRIEMKYEDVQDRRQGQELFMGAYFFNQAFAGQLESASAEQRTRVIAAFYAFYMKTFNEKDKEAYGLKDVQAQELARLEEALLEKMKARGLENEHTGAVVAVLKYLYHAFLDPDRASDAAQGAILTENMDIDTALKAFVTALSPNLADEGRQVRLFKDLRRYIAKKPQTQDLNDFVRNVFGELLRAYAESQGNEKFFAEFVMELNKKVITIDALKVAILYGNDQKQELMSWASVADEVVKDTIAMIKADPGAALDADAAQITADELAGRWALSMRTKSLPYGGYKGTLDQMSAKLLSPEERQRVMAIFVESVQKAYKKSGQEFETFVDAELEGAYAADDEFVKGQVHLLASEVRQENVNYETIVTAVGILAHPTMVAEDKFPQLATKGGIDLNSASLDMQIKRDGKGVVLPVGQQDLDNIRINGLVPVILDIKPATSVPLFSELPTGGSSAA